MVSAECVARFGMTRTSGSVQSRNEWEFAAPETVVQDVPSPAAAELGYETAVHAAAAPVARCKADVPAIGDNVAVLVLRHACTVGSSIHIGAQTAWKGLLTR